MQAVRISVRVPDPADTDPEPADAMDDDADLDAAEHVEALEGVAE